ncbi:MAG: NAD+ synthase [Candidatus Omnitrophica bacterium]|nr:NAD+ synthase [Candidatus Omnitrophota bacterium]
MLKIALAQINTTVGDFAGNANLILDYMARAKRAKARLVVFPELAVCGYPPEDLLLKKHFVENNLKTLSALAKKVHGVSAVVGFVDADSKGKIYNAAAFINEGVIKAVYRKNELPNYGVFDEKRYFQPGRFEAHSGVATIEGRKIGLSICEDIWIDTGVYAKQAKAGAKILVNLSASPYEVGKLKVRHDLLSRRAKETKTTVVYCNLVGGQDELVFDGASMVFSPQGKLLARARQFEEELLVCDVDAKENPIAPILEETQEIYQALVVGTRDYVQKNGFTKVALGLSGGIDSALVAVIAVDALTAENVTAISMPSRFNAKATRQDARVVAKNLGIEFKEIPIQAIHNVYLRILRKHFNRLAPNIAEENLQARIRGNLLMAFSNKFGWLVLTTGNKSEMAVGYCTLYGDMSGGFAPLKDIFKTKAYTLARWRNAQQRTTLIPKSVFLRAPTAELRANQTDEESLGAYEQLDGVLASYVQAHQSLGSIAKDSAQLPYVKKTINLVDKNEYKRRQGPPGVKITARAFGRDWRLPITNKYKE